MSESVAVVFSELPEAADHVVVAKHFLAVSDAVQKDAHDCHRPYKAHLVSAVHVIPAHFVPVINVAEPVLVAIVRKPVLLPDVVAAIEPTQFLVALSGHDSFLTRDSIAGFQFLREPFAVRFASKLQASNAGY